MVRFIGNLLTAVILCVILAASASAADASYFVQIIGSGGRVDLERGPFGSYEEAQQWARDWQSARPNDYRLWKIKENPNAHQNKTPLDRFLAAGVQEIDELLNQTKTVSTVSGEGGPMAGAVLGEYKADVENAYQGAKALRDRMTQFADSAPKEILGKMDALVVDITRQESERFVMIERSKIVKTEFDKQAAIAKEKQSDIRELIDQIGRTKGTEQQALLEKLRQLQKSGSIKNAVVAEAKTQDARDDYNSTKKTIENLEREVVENREQQRDILQTLSSTTNIHDLTGMNGLWFWSGGGDASYEFQPSGGVTVRENGVISSIFSGGTWERKANHLTFTQEKPPYGWRFEGTIQGSRLVGKMYRGTRVVDESFDFVLQP